MIDIQILRDNPDLVREKSAQKQVEVDIDKILALDKEHRDLLQQVESLRQQRNEVSAQMKGGKPNQELIDRGKQIKIELADREQLLQKTSAEFSELFRKIPNLPHDDVPVGSSEDENVVVETVGELPHFDFEAKSHADIAVAKGWLDKERAAKVSGARFAYLKGDLVRLQWAMMQFGTNCVTDEEVIKKVIQEYELNISTKPFVPVLPPHLIKTDMYEAMDRLEPRDDRYKIEGEDLWLQGSAEHVLGSMHANEIISEAELPLRYVGYATSFRREAGTYGKDTEGIIRMHQFDKLEMQSLASPEQSYQEHILMIGLQKHLMDALQLPYQVINKCTADIGKPNARGWDIDVWLPGQDKYRETHTADYMTDYQARRLNTRLRRADNTIELVHTNDATAFSQRPLIAIIENYQTNEGDVLVPEVLRPYMGGKERI